MEPKTALDIVTPSLFNKTLMLVCWEWDGEMADGVLRGEFYMLTDPMSREKMYKKYMKIAKTMQQEEEIEEREGLGSNYEVIEVDGTVEGKMVLEKVVPDPSYPPSLVKKQKK